MKYILFMIFIWIAFTFPNRAQWQPISDPLGKEIRCMIKSGDNIAVGTEGNGVYISQNSFKSWNQVNSGLSNLKVYSLTLKGSTIFAGTYGDGVFISDNNGTSWIKKSVGLNPPFIFSMLTVGNQVYAGGDKNVYTTTDDGNSWKVVQTANYIAVALYHNNGNIYLGIGPHVYRSPSNELDWKLLATANYTIKAFAELPTDKGTPLIFVGTLDGMFLSTNNGTSWKAINKGISYTNINSLAVYGSNIFAGTENGGIYMTTNSGNDWVDINDGFPAQTSVRALLVDSGVLYAATAAGTVWKRNASELLSSSIDNDPKDNSNELIQVFPNPASEKFDITLNLPSTSTFNLSIFDLLGKKVYQQEMTAVNSVNNIMSVPVNGLTPGYYNLRIEFGNTIIDRKLVVN